MISIPRYFTRDYIQKHRQWNFIYGTALDNSSYFGQAGAAKGESNAFYVVTKIRLCRSNNDAYFKDVLFDEAKQLIDLSINKIPRDKPLIRFPRIGCGAAELPTRAPLVLKYLNAVLSTICDPDFVIDYYMDI